MKKYTQQEFEETHVIPLENYILSYLSDIPKKSLETFACDLGIDNIRDMITSLLLDNQNGTNTKPTSSGNPFKSLFAEIFFEKATISPDFLTKKRKNMFHRIQRCYVLYSLENKSVPELIKFRSKIENKSFDTDDPLLNKEFIKDLNLLINKKKK